MLKPQLVLHYNATKKVFGMSDQMSTYLTALTKTIIKCTGKGFEIRTGTNVGNAWILYDKIMPNEILIPHFKKSFVESLKIQLFKNYPDTYDTRARNVQQMHVLEEASGPKQKFASATYSAMKHLHRMRAPKKQHYLLRFL